MISRAYCCSSRSIERSRSFTTSPIRNENRPRNFTKSFLTLLCFFVANFSVYSPCPLRFPKRALLDHILNLLFPNTCVQCHAPVQKRRWGGACPECWSSLIPLVPPFCAKCGEPSPAIEGLCGLCIKAEHAFDFARSALLFTRTLREIIHHLKYSDRVSFAKPLGDILKECLEREPFVGNMIIPVPLH